LNLSVFIVLSVPRAISLMKAAGNSSAAHGIANGWGEWQRWWRTVIDPCMPLEGSDPGAAACVLYNAAAAYLQMRTKAIQRRVRLGACANLKTLLERSLISANDAHHNTITVV
jgi:hypothetical protein